MVKKPKVKPCVSASIFGCQRLSQSVSPENKTNSAQAIIKSGALRKKRKGKSIGGKALNDKPDMFIASL